MKKVKKLYSKQKQAIKAISTFTLFRFKNRRFDEKIGIFYICKLNTYHVINLMFRVKNNALLEAFENMFEIVHHHYPTRYNEYNFAEPKTFFKATKFAISSRVPCLWNFFTDKNTKTITSTSLFKRRLNKNYLIKIKNITNCF